MTNLKSDAWPVGIVCTPDHAKRTLFFLLPFLILGCDESREPPFAVQAEQVRAGKATSIVAQRSTVRDADLESLRGMDALEELAIERAEVTSRGVAALAEL